MELRDYLRMLRRGWLAIVLVTALFVGLGAVYVSLTPRSFESTTVLFVSANNPDNIGDLQAGNQFSTTAVTTYANIVASPTVLGPEAAVLRPQGNVDEMSQKVWTVVPEDTTLINLTASSSDPERAADVANAVGETATRVLPALVTNAQGRPLVKVQQIRPAVAPSHAVSPNVQQTLMLALIIGLCLGLAGTIVAQALDTRIRRVDDLQGLTDTPLLAVVAPRKRGQRKGLAVRDDPSGPTGEQFRTLRTNIAFTESKERRSLVFAGVADGREGAQVPANLAWSLAQAGWRVLLVDLDLRQSTVGDTVGIKPGPGLADVLSGRIDLREAIRETAEQRVRVVLSGTKQTSPSDLLSAPAMNDLLRRMEREHDYVIMHAPPVLSYTDTALVSRAAGGTVLTVAVGRTRAQELTTALATLANVRIKPLGLVLTRARRTDGLLGLLDSGGPRTQAATPTSMATPTLQMHPAQVPNRSVPLQSGPKSGPTHIPKGRPAPGNGGVQPGPARSATGEAASPSPVAKDGRSPVSGGPPAAAGGVSAPATGSGAARTTPNGQPWPSA